MSAANAATGWQIGEPGRPVLSVDYNESDEEGLMMAAAAPWKLEVGQRIYVSDADGLCCQALVRSFFDSEFVMVEAVAPSGGWHGNL